MFLQNARLYLPLSLLVNQFHLVGSHLRRMLDLFEMDFCELLETSVTMKPNEVVTLQLFFM